MMWRSKPPRKRSAWRSAQDAIDGEVVRVVATMTPAQRVAKTTAMTNATACGLPR